MKRWTIKMECSNINIMAKNLRKVYVIKIMRLKQLNQF